MNEFVCSSLDPLIVGKRTKQEKQAASKKRLETKKKKEQIIQDFISRGGSKGVKRSSSDNVPDSYVKTGDEDTNPIAPKKTKGYVSKAESTLEAMQKESNEEIEDYESDQYQYWRESPDYKFSHLRKPLDEKRFEEGRGCGGALPILTRVELEFSAVYILPWEGDPSKETWKTHYSYTPFTPFDISRCVTDEDQILIGKHE